MTFREYSFGYKILGQGLTSTVYKAKKNKSKQQFAIKIIKDDFLKSQFEKKLLLNEIYVHEAVNHHKNFVSLIQHGKFQKSYIFVMEYCEKGSLADFLSKNKKLTETEAVYIIKEVIEAFKHLETLKILHRDIKPANILFTEKNEIKLCDFGLSIKVSDRSQNKLTRFGTPCFMAPEVVQKFLYTSKSDIWSIGVTYFLMLTGQLPFKSHNYDNFLKQVNQTDLNFIISENFSDFSKKFILRTLKLDPKQRMSSQELFSFKFQTETIPRGLKSCISQEVIRQKISKKYELRKNVTTKDLYKHDRILNINTETVQDSNINQKSFSKNLDTQSSEKCLKVPQKPEKKTVQPKDCTIQRAYRTLEVAPKAQKDKSNQCFKQPYQPNRKQQNLKVSTDKNQVQNVNNKEEEVTAIKQMEKVTKILLNQIDFLRYGNKIIHLLEKYFKNESDSLKDMIQSFVSVKLKELKDLTFISESKLKIYMKYPLYKAWIQVIEDFSRSLKFSQKGKLRQEDLQNMISGAILQIYLEFDKSLKTKQNIARLITLDHLVCFRDLLRMQKKGVSYFLKYSLIHLILQGIEKTTINPQQIEDIFLGISKKLSS